jgi:hypothetical protein
MLRWRRKQQPITTDTQIRIIWLHHRRSAIFIGRVVGTSSGIAREAGGLRGLRKVRLLLWSGLVWIWCECRRVWLLLCILVLMRCLSIWGSLAAILRELMLWVLL